MNMEKVELGFHGLPMGKCQRCGCFAELYKENPIDKEGETHEVDVCWDCSFDIRNDRGDPFTKECEDEEDW